MTTHIADLTLHYQRIDQVFSTTLADNYTPEAKAANDQITYGMMPPPMSGGKAPGNLKGLAKSGQVIDRGGYTKAGRALMKHGSRDGSVFPKPTGNLDGQEMLEAILSHPEKKMIPGEFERFGQVTDIYAPGIGGVRYSSDGELIGFLEP